MAKSIRHQEDIQQERNIQWCIGSNLPRKNTTNIMDRFRQMKIKVPRKIKKQIPQGPYCYFHLGSVITETEYYVKIKPCFFYRNLKMKDLPKQDKTSKKHPDEIVGFCGLLKDRLSIDDQVKDCSINCSYKK
jgi:hypothetical protein